MVSTPSRRFWEPAKLTVLLPFSALASLAVKRRFPSSNLALRQWESFLLEAPKTKQERGLQSNDHPARAGPRQPESWASGPCSSPGMGRGFQGSPQHQGPHLCVFSPPRVLQDQSEFQAQQDQRERGRVREVDQRPLCLLCLRPSVLVPETHRATASQPSCLSPHLFLLDPASTSCTSSLMILPACGGAAGLGCSFVY